MKDVCAFFPKRFNNFHGFRLVTIRISLPSGPTIRPDVQALSANKQISNIIVTIRRESSMRRAQWGEAAENLLIAAAENGGLAGYK
jgi:hypothetical protein